jgi:hypothetical protein
MPRERCLITYRLAGPCARCRQAAWPAHVRGFEIYCEACCGCGRGGAEAAGAHAAPGHEALAAQGRHQGQAHGMPPARSGPAHAMPLERATGLATALERGGKARSTTPPAARVSGAVSAPAQAILRGDLLGAALAFEQAPGLTAAPEIYFPPARSMPPARRGRSGYRPPPWPAPPPQGLQARAKPKFPPLLAAKHFRARMLFRAKILLEVEP